MLTSKTSVLTWITLLVAATAVGATTSPEAESCTSPEAVATCSVAGLGGFGAWSFCHASYKKKLQIAKAITKKLRCDSMCALISFAFQERDLHHPGVKGDILIDVW